MKLFRRKWITIPLGLIFLVLLTLVLLIAWVRSEAGSNRALEFAKDYLAKNQGTQLTYSFGRIDPLTGLHFKNLKIVRELPPVKATILIESVDVGYELSLGQRRLDINEFKVIHPQITARIEPDTSEPQPTPTPASSAGKSLDDIIHDPPVQIYVRDLAIENLDLDVIQKSTTGELLAKFTGLDVHTHFEMLKDQFKISGDANTGSGIKVRQKAKAPDGSASATHLGVAASGKWDIDIHHESTGWIYLIKPSEWKTSLKDVAFESESPKSQMSVAIPSLTFNSTVEVKARSQQLFKLDAESVEVVNAKGLVHVGPLTMSQSTPASAPKQITTIAGQDVAFTSGLAANQVQAEVKYTAHQIMMAPTLAKPMDLLTDLKASLPRDLSAVRLDGTVQSGDMHLASVKASTKRNPDGAMGFVGALTIEVDQRLAAYVKAAAALKKTGPVKAQVDFAAQRSVAGAIAASIKADIPKVIPPALTKPAAIQLATELAMNAEQSHLDINANVGLQSSEVGDWKVTSKLETSLPPAEPSKKSGLPPIKGSGRTEITQARAPTVEKPLIPATFPRPFVITHAYDLGVKPGSLDVKAEIPAVNALGLAKLDDTKVSFTLRSPDLAAVKDLDIRAELSQGAIELEPSLALQGVKKISGATMKLVATLRGGVDVSLDDFNATVDGTTVQMTAQAAGNIKTKNLQANATFALKVPDNFPSVNGASVRGRFDIPLTINVLHGKEISLVGDVNARDLAVKKESIAASGINGKFPFNEKLIYDGKAVRFASLIVQNPFERVDFERVRPLLQGSEQFRVDKIQWEEKSYGPFIGFFSLRQNVIYAHQFDMDIGTGRLSGELFFDAYPKNLQFGSLARLTNVNLGEVLPQKFLARAPGGDKNISGRSGFVVNLNRGTMDGRIDVTEIGGAQLIALANILDPGYEDEKLNKIRTLLQVGYPTQVQMEFAEGYLNMEIGLHVLGINQRQSVRGIPISSLLSNATSDIVKETEKGPLQ